jgi:hypothetical protein
MAIITIKDLDESKEMDRQAMRAVTGGCATAHFNKPLSPYRSPLIEAMSANSLFGWAATHSSGQPY